MDIVEVSREHLRKKLNKCSDVQIKLFNRMYVSIDTIPFEKMIWAEKQIDRTLTEKDGE